jgi:Mycolic acid cyclopropane synthetase
MSNMYGYSDYDGPKIASEDSPFAEALHPVHPQLNDGNNNDDDDDDDDDDNPLQVGFWMEGDSLAPPCGTSISTIHQILQYLQLEAKDILYDLGCGDGRICLEAWHRYHCTTIGIEVEVDLVSRAQSLITQLSAVLSSEDPSLKNLPQVHCMDLRQIFREWMVITTSDVENDDITNHTPSKIFPLPTIIFLYLLPEALLEIEPSLLQLLLIAPKNCRIVCNTWGIPNWKPIQETTIPERTAAGVSTTIFVYTTDSVPHK